MFRKNFDFLLLSWISSVVEIGCILFGLSHSFSIYEIVGLGLAYQLGNLVPNPIQLTSRMVTICALLALSLFITSFYIEHYLIYFFGFWFLSAAIQSVRSYSKQNVSTGLKRSLRILGFLTAPLMNLPVLIFFCLSVTLISLLYSQRKQIFNLYFPSLCFIDWLMIIHQMHYFSYTYFILYLMYEAIHSAFWVSIWFCFGWVTYTSISYLLKSSYYFTYFIIGHFFLFIVLLLLGLSLDMPTVFILLWILTGFGGGTVFCIDKINEMYFKRNKNSLVFSENVGHVAGVLAGLGLFFFSQQPAVPVYLGAICALIAMLMMLYLAMKLKSKSEPGS